MNLSLTASTFILPDQAELTIQQQQIKRQILKFAQEHRHDQQPAIFVLTGDAGSGKSAVLSTVFSSLQQQAQQPTSPLAGTKNYLLVNHNEMLKIYWEIAQQQPFLYKKNFQKPTPFINHCQKTQQSADVVFVDEAQLLLSQADHFNHFQADNQLDELLKCTHVLVLVLDFKQVVKLKSYWSEKMLRQHLAGYHVKIVRLQQQLRLKSPAVADWIDQLVAGKLLPPPRTADYELKIFTDGQPLFDWIKQKDQQVGLSRMLATTDFPFRVFSKEPWYVIAGTLKLPWDRFNYQDRPWASQSQTLYEVGSIYTIQGFDLNYAGVILGPSLTYDFQADSIVIHPEKFEDQTALQKRHQADLADLTAARSQLIKNVVNILLKRGRYGLGIYATDVSLRYSLEELSVS
ncbi:MAG: DUF2075 domain-containing protein [Liquorilactobacillus ghanensis]|uniref:DUF2075 domain-containing protein n=1 Tax=Liquorilactobacillus ghanensis TaxID=399370 RepID=UPI0039EA841D